MVLNLVAVAAAALLAAVPAPVAPPAPSPTPREAFDRGRTAFGRAEYQRAIEILDPLLYPEVMLETEGEIVQAHRMLGVAYLFANRPDDAKREFRKLLALRPDYRFDPLLDPQRVVDFFDAVVKEEQANIAALQAALQRKRDQERRRQVVKLPPPTVVRYQRNSYFVSFIPFGAGQFQNGHRGKGWFFLTSEAALAAISVGAFATNLALYGLHPHRGCLVPVPDDGSGCPPEQIDRSEEETSNTLLRVQVVSGGLFFAAAIWGIIDASRHYRRDVLLTRDDGAPRGSEGPRFLFSPSGVGAAWTF